MRNSYANLIYWVDASSSYLFGTKLIFENKNKVIFENELMSPGKELVSWNSATVFQLDRKVPQLPNLEKGKKYRVNLKLKAIPESSVWLKVTFKDIKEQVIKDIFIKDSETTFSVPSQTNSYQFALINAGCKKVIFKRIELAEESLENQIINHELEDFYVLVDNNHENSDRTNIYFQEPELNIARAANVDKHSILIGSMLTDAALFVNPEVEKIIAKQVASGKELRLHGMGPISFFACLYYSQKFGIRHISGRVECGAFEKYLEIAKKYSPEIVAVVQSLAKLIAKYQPAKENQQVENLALVTTLFEREFQE